MFKGEASECQGKAGDWHEISWELEREMEAALTSRKIQTASSCSGATEQHWLLCKTAWGWESLGSRDTRSDRGGVRVRYDRPPPLRTNVTTTQSKSLERVLQTVMPPLCTLEPPFTAVCFSNLTSQVVTSSGSFVSHWVGAVARDWWSWLFSHRELLAVSSLPKPPLLFSLRETFTGTG